MGKGYYEKELPHYGPLFALHFIKIGISSAMCLLFVKISLIELHSIANSIQLTDFYKWSPYPHPSHCSLYTSACLLLLSFTNSLTQHKLCTEQREQMLTRDRDYSLTLYFSSMTNFWF